MEQIFPQKTLSTLPISNSIPPIFSSGPLDIDRDHASSHTSSSLHFSIDPSPSTEVPTSSSSSVDYAAMQPNDIPPLRRSSRISHLPSYLQNYKCDLPFTFNVISTHLTSQHLVNFVLCYDHLSPQHRSFGLIVRT